MKNSYIWRIRLLSSAVLVFAMVLGAKLYLVQVVHGEIYAEKSESQYYKPTQSSSSRGSIYFSNKDGTVISAALQKNGFIIAINPKIIPDAEAVYEKINAIWPIPKEFFMAKALKKDDPYEEIAKRVEESKGEAIQDLQLKGVYILRDKWRFYPGDSLASHVLGIVAYKGDELGGRYGLENYYEKILRRNSANLYVNFFAEIFSNASKVIVKQDELEGDIVTTIEPNVEIALERELKKIYDKWSPDSVGAVIVDPKTGEIYAMASYPSFNLNSFQNEKSSRIFSNPIVEDVYEMGSIIKPLTMAAGLDAGAVKADTVYDDKGFGILNNSRFSNYDGKARGLVSMQEVLNQSLNTGVAHVVSKMGKLLFAQYMLNFGLGEKTGVDLPNEASGLVENLKSPREIEYANASFGQGIAMTPISTVRALSALANGGTLPTPHIVKKIDYDMGFSKTAPATSGRRVIKKETSEEISRMLVEVVDTALLDGKVKLPNYSVAAKTGTAQISMPNKKGYYDDRYLHSFFGYFPAYNPRFLVFFYTVNPKGVKYASETLTYPFMDITNFLINYYEIPPDR